MSEKDQSAADAVERFNAFMADRTKDAVIVDVKAPSGFVYKFEKPNKFSLIFSSGSLPQVAASTAVEKWTEAGVIKAIQAGDTEVLAAADSVFALRDRVLRLSYSPKLVIGTAKNPGELSTDLVPDEDLDFLLRWVSAGGEVAGMLGNFPYQSGGSASTGTHRRKVRTKAK